MTERNLIDRPAVARRLGHTLEWLYKHMPELVENGFPKPAIGNQRSARWDPKAIDIWLDTCIASTMQVMPPSFVVSSDLAADAAELDRRSAELAGSRRRRA